MVYPASKSRIKKEEKIWSERHLKFHEYPNTPIGFTTLKIEGDNVKEAADARKILDEISDGLSSGMAKMQFGLPYPTQMEILTRSSRRWRKNSTWLSTEPKRSVSFIFMGLPRNSCRPLLKSPKRSKKNPAQATKSISSSINFPGWLIVVSKVLNKLQAKMQPFSTWCRSGL